MKTLRLFLSVSVIMVGLLAHLPLLGASSANPTKTKTPPDQTSVN